MRIFLLLFCFLFNEKEKARKPFFQSKKREKLSGKTHRTPKRTVCGFFQKFFFFFVPSLGYIISLMKHTGDLFLYLPLYRQSYKYRFSVRVYSVLTCCIRKKRNGKYKKYYRNKPREKKGKRCIALLRNSGARNKRLAALNQTAYFFSLHLLVFFWGFPLYFYLRTK